MADLYVTSAASSGDGSFSAIVSSSVNKDKIYFDDTIFTDGKVVITSSNNTISGKDNFFIVDNDKEVTFDSQQANRFLTVTNGSVAEFNNSGFTNGKITGNGGAIQVIGKAALRGSNVKFANNSSTNVGGAAYIGSAGATFSNASFLNNSSSMGGALYAECAITIADSYFSGNSATYNGAAGGAIQFAGAGNSVITKTYFTGNSGKNGGTIAVNNASANVTFTGSTFKENTATNVGGAFYINQGTVNVNDTLFDGNIKGALYLESTGVANINGATFAKASDTITNNGTLTFSGDILLGAAVSGKGSYTVSGASFTFINSGTVSIADMGDETTVAGVNFNGGQVNFSAWDLSNVDIAVTAALPASGSVTLATGLTLDAEQKVKVNGADVALNSVFGNGVYQLNYASGTLSISVEALAVTSAEVSGEGSLSAILDAAGTTDMQKIVFADALFTDGKATLSAAESLLTAFADGLTLAAGTDREVILDAAGAGRIAAIASNSTVNYENVSFANGSANGENISGGAVYINAATVSFAGSEFTGNKAKSNGGAVWVTNHASSAVKAAAQLTDVTFTGNESGNVGGALYVQRGSAIVTNGYFSGNKSKSGGAIYVDSEAAVTVNGAEFATSTDTVYNAGTLTFGGSITLNSALGGDGTYVIAKDTVFTNAVDLSAVNISVDGSLYDGKAVTIAAGVSAIGNYTTGNENLFLTVENGSLILREANISSDAATFTGTGSNLMTAGTVGTLFADKSGASNIATTILGGKVESNLVGGAYVAAGNTAEVDKVELLIGGTAEVAAKVYAGGYLYGNAGDAEAAAEAQLTVKSVNINIDGGAVSTNMYGGAHARQFGNASVTEVNITVTDGSHSRIYAGGWAEKGAVSSVGIANVIISGGSVDYLYGAGANADGKTYVTTTNITVSDDAVVNTIFMGGRYGYSWVDNVNLTFAGENKELTRLSGVSSAGMDYAKATVVELATNVTADLIDYVDKFVINEGYTLTAVDEFYLGDRNNETGATEDFTTFDFIAEGEANWTAVAGISDFTNAKFAVNGIEGSEWKDNVMAIGDYTLTRSDADKDGKYIIAITKK